MVQIVAVFCQDTGEAIKPVWLENPNINGNPTAVQPGGVGFSQQELNNNGLYDIWQGVFVLHPIVNEGIRLTDLFMI